MELLIIAALVLIGLIAFFTIGSFLIALTVILILFEVLPWWALLIVIAVYVLRPSNKCLDNCQEGVIE